MKWLSKKKFPIKEIQCISANHSSLLTFSINLYLEIIIWGIIHLVRTFTYQEIRDVNFSEKFEYVLKWTIPNPTNKFSKHSKEHLRVTFDGTFTH